MDNPESHIDSYLNEFLNRYKQAEETRQQFVHSNYFKHFHDFDPGDRVSMTLAGIAFNGTFTQRLIRVEAVLNDPQMALIDVKLADDLEEWEGKTIGLGVCAELPKKGIPRLYSRFIAGTWDVAYYLPEDIQKDDLGRPEVPQEKLRLLGLQYVRVVVGGSAIIEPPKG